jgi:membrane protein DedA with SNARE-associated domain
MDIIAPWLANALVVAGRLKYPLLLVGVVVEGPILMVASGFLLRLGLFEPVPLFLTVVLGDLVGDVIWYYVGYYALDWFLRTRGHFLSVTPKVLEQMRKLYHKHHEKILFFSKISLGFGMSLATLTVAGASRIPFKRYMLFNALGEFVLVAVLLTAGYLFGNFYDQLARDLKVISLVGLAVMLIVATVGFSRYVKRVILSEQ